MTNNAIIQNKNAIKQNFTYLYHLLTPWARETGAPSTSSWDFNIAIWISTMVILGKILSNPEVPVRLNF